ncbi:MAG: HlyD family efflux transporter periplasmic adaptor subunit [Clostridiales bacterium]|nr:HlyD family efflux transporter periplasmic adaptor subunit [Clostridiales bacterium]
MDVREKITGAELSKQITAPRPEKSKRTKKARRKLIRRTVVVVILLIAVSAGALYFFGPGRTAAVDPATLYTFTAAALRDISSSLEGSGTLQPANSYTVTTLVSGEILSAGFEEGDVVFKGDVLYEIDSSDSSTGIERAESSLEQSRRNYNKKLGQLAELTVRAPISGVVTGLDISVGDNVGTQGAIATIEDNSALTLTEYYSDEYADYICVGMAATVSVPGQMMTLAGHVTEISSFSRMSETGVSCFGVTVSVSNPGSLTPGSSATASLDGIYPSISDDDGLDAKEKRVVYAKVSGTAAQVNVRNFEKISAGDTIMMLTSDTLDDEIQNALDSLRDAELSLQSQYDSLDNYTVTAPIDGTIIEKYYEEGETSDSGKTLCTIYDLSSLSLTMNVDELDISAVEVGQRATIAADSVEGKVYEGVVTRVGVNGTTSGGVTTYPVAIRIDETGGLLPGMNVDITIIVEESAGVLAIPSAAVARGDLVLVKTAGGGTGDGSPVEGFEYAAVETGLSDSDYVEIISGLSEGDEIAYINDIVTSDGFVTGETGFGFSSRREMVFNESGPHSGGGMPQGGGSFGGPGGGF